MCVGKTFFWDWLRRHRYDVERLRRYIKNARPKPVAKNVIWGLDLTGKASLDAKTHAVLGILEHASRAAPWLEALEGKSKLAQAIRRFG